MPPPVLTGSTAFDNRSQPLSGYSTYRLKRRLKFPRRIYRILTKRPLPYYVGGNAHLHFEFEGRRFVFAVIFKNAWSTFSRFVQTAVTGPSPEGIDLSLWLKNRLDKFDSYQAQGSQCNLFIYRDPLERVVSLFNDKFIKSPNKGASVLVNFESLTGGAAANTTFEEFVNGFLVPHFFPLGGKWALDMHMVPQADCLWPIKYHEVLRMESLLEDVGRVFGSDVAEQYFSTRVNATASAALDGPLHQLRASELREIYRDTGRMPARDNFITPEIEVTLRRLYAIDYELGTMLAP